MAFNSLRKDEHFSDVTLACENRQFQAHKVVLSAGSSFFEQILKSHKHPSPLVYLKGVEAKHMELLLDYIYSGEVVIKQEELDYERELACVRSKLLADNKAEVEKVRNETADDTDNKTSRQQGDETSRQQGDAIMRQ